MGLEFYLLIPSGQLVIIYTEKRKIKEVCNLGKFQPLFLFTETEKIVSPNEAF